MSREYEYITPGTTHDLDMGMADLVAMESFNTSTRTGRDSYFKVSLKRYHCAEEFVVGEGKKVVLAMKYDVAEDCETARAFFTCTWPTLVKKIKFLNVMDELFEGTIFNETIF